MKLPTVPSQFPPPGARSSIITAYAEELALRARMCNEQQFVQALQLMAQAAASMEIPSWDWRTHPCVVYVDDFPVKGVVGLRATTSEAKDKQAFLLHVDDLHHLKDVPDAKSALLSLTSAARQNE